MVYRISSPLLSIAFLVLASSLLSSCGTASSISSSAINTNGTSQSLQQEITKVLAMQPPAVPPNIVNLSIDKSGSMASARIPDTTFSDVELILKSLSQTGGTLAVSLICERSDRPLIRVTLLQPPRFHQTQLPPEPEKPPKLNNPYKQREKLEQYQQAVREYNQQVALVRQQLETYEQRLARHQTDTQQRIDAIKPPIEEVLQRPSICQSTDIQRTVQRANLLFNEPVSWTETPRKYAVFITDGLDSFSSEPAQLQADRVLLVNGSEELGIFHQVAHERFESPTAALTMLAKWMRE